MKAGVSANDSIDGVSRIVWKEGTEGYTLKADASLHAEVLCGGNQELLDAFFRWG